MNKSFRFTLLKTDGQARRGRLETKHGTIETPAFMPVGTAGSVKGLTIENICETGAQIVLGNTYHLMVRPGAERLFRLGGLRRFMGWEGPVLTDSGGYQVMSLSRLRRIQEEGIAFASHLDGARFFLSPERAMEVQRLLDSTIHMQLDECIAFPHGFEDAECAMQRSLRWALRSREAFGEQEGRGCFGIVQGGIDWDLRAFSARELIKIGFDGYAIGGLAVGEGQALMLKTLEGTVPHLPATHPRYLMGVGTPLDLLQSVARGIDMFDCVMPTRSGRHGQLFTKYGKINLKNAQYAEDLTPLDPESPHPLLAKYSRAYLHHLVRCGELLGMVILSFANLLFYQNLMQAMREAISDGKFETFCQQTLSCYHPERSGCYLEQSEASPPE